MLAQMTEFGDNWMISVLMILPCISSHFYCGLETTSYFKICCHTFYKYLSLSFIIKKFLESKMVKIKKFRPAHGYRGCFTSRIIKII